MRIMFGTPQRPLGHRKQWYNGHHAAAAALFVIATGWATAARADSIVEYELNGQPGNQASTIPTFFGAGVTGISMTRGAGLTASAAANSMSASGWDGPNANDFFQFGFNVSPGSTVTVNSLLLATRSSATGPGSINLLISVDGGSETLLTTLAQPNALFLDESLSFAPISVTSSFRVVVRSANNTAANGGTVGSAGTFRISDYSPNGGTTFQPVTISGSITTTAATPEPGSLLLAASGLISLAGIIRRRK